jgi:hypothetical protein
MMEDFQLGTIYTGKDDDAECGMFRFGPFREG